MFHNYGRSIIMATTGSRIGRSQLIVRVLVMSSRSTSVRRAQKYSFLKHKSSNNKRATIQYIDCKINFNSLTIKCISKVEQSRLNLKILIHIFAYLVVHLWIKQCLEFKIICISNRFPADLDQSLRQTHRHRFRSKAF